MAEAKKKVEATKPTPEEKQAAAEAEVDALVVELQGMAKTGDTKCEF